MGPGDLVPLRAEDALFLHAQNEHLCQQVGTVLLLDTDSLSATDFRAEIAQRVRGIPRLRRRLEQPPGRWRRPRWITESGAEAGGRIDTITFGPGSTGRSLHETADAFFSEPTDPWRAPWAMLFVRGLPGRQTAIMVKVHHTLGGSQAIIAALTQLFDAAPRTSAPRRPAEGAHPQSRRRVRQTALTAGGLWHLARAGRAPASSLCGRSTSEHRRYIPLALAARDVAITARRLDTGIAELLLAVIAEAIGQLLRSRGEVTDGRVVRAAVPRAQDRQPGMNRSQPSNQSAVVTVDVPVGPLSPAERLNAVSRQFRAHLGHGEPGAAAFVLRAMNALPPPLQRLSAVLVYHHRWFNLLVSIFPGIRGEQRMLGVPVREVYPVLALAEGVGLAIGAMTWGKSLSVGILADAALVPDVDLLAAEFTAAFHSFQAASPGDDHGWETQDS
jgi:WS/DGAT/MGAT family acyltransferase